MSNIAIYARKSTESEDRQILSIDSQVRELKDHAKREGLVISRVFIETKSAKAPGRPVFNELFGLVQSGRIDGVLCWKLDRLARNPVDGGAVIWAMEERKLATIYTPQRAFANTGNDKFWMQLEFGMAKKYVDDLSDNVKRGLRAKIAAGWMPGLPPLGYLNDQNNHTIVKDPERFPLVRKMWDFMLSGSYTPPRILDIATNQWGLRTRLFKRIGGKPLAMSAVYKLFRSPFYYGALVHKGEHFQGQHAPMIRKSEFDRVQGLLSQSSSPRPQEHTFAFTGLIRCGECGASITAERKVNRHGSEYVYYHCTKRRPSVSCSQRVVQVGELERQIVAFLDTITISQRLADWAVHRVRELGDEEREKDRSSVDSQRRRLAACSRELKELIDIRLRGLLSDDEYLIKKRELEEERVHLQELLNNVDGQQSLALDQAVDAFRFAQTARARFEQGSADAKRLVLQYVGSNLSLKDRILTIQPQKPLFFIQRTISSPRDKKLMFEPMNFSEPQRQNGSQSREVSIWRGLVDEVRTFFLQNTSIPTLKKRWSACGKS